MGLSRYVENNGVMYYEKMCAKMAIKEYHKSGHDIREKEKIPFYSKFLRSTVIRQKERFN